MLEAAEEKRTRAFLKTLETKGLPGGFSGYGGGAYGGAQGNSMFPFAYNFLPGAHYDYEREAGELWLNSAVSACIGWLERNFPEPRPIVQRRAKGGTWEEAKDHPSLQTIVEPNPFYEDDVLWTGNLISYLCDGNGYMLKGSTLDGRTRELYWVPHWQVFPRWPDGGREFITHYEYIVDGRRTELRLNEVIHFRNGIDPANYRRGLSKLRSALREVCTDNQAAGMSAALCRNFGVIGAVIDPENEDDTWEKEDREEVKEMWSEGFTGENRGKPLVSGRRIRVTPITTNFDKATFDKIRMIPEARICAAIGLNPQVVGLSCGEASKTYKNYPEARQAAYEDCLMPLQRRWARQLTKQCPELFKPGVERLSWDYSEVAAMQAYAAENAKRATVLFQGELATRNEARKVANMPPTDKDGEEFHVGQPLRGSQPTLKDNTMGEGE